HPARRGAHGARDAELRQGRRARLRPQDRRGHADRGAAQPRRHPRLPGHRRRHDALMVLLEVRDLEAQYGWTKVLHGLSFAVEEGGITTILGANGAGKTTTLRAVCGMVKTRGEVRFDGRAIAGRATEDLVRLGIAHLPARRGTFVNLTVEQDGAMALRLADRAYLMETGRMVMSGSASELREHDTVRRAYLGY